MEEAKNYGTWNGQKVMESYFSFMSDKLTTKELKLDANKVH